jgi:hypothetical protein
VTAGKPFFLYLTPHIPHEPSTPAPRYVNAFNGEPAPRLDSYNEEDVSDKPPWISSLPKISSTEAAAIQQRHEKRIESLQAVDEAVKDIVNKLSATGQLTNTYIVFTSDNGWQRGEHRIPRGKAKPYEESSHMPLLIRGPGVAPKSTANSLVTFPDFMPTFLELGGIAIPDYVDGRSLVPLWNGTVKDNDERTDDWRTAVLLEGRNESHPEQYYFAIRTADGVKYIEYASGFKEYYNLNTDPNEMSSTPGSASATLVDRLQRLKTCAGATCRSIENEGGVPPPEPPTGDTTKPQITITTPPQGATYTLNQSVAASYECTDADSGVASCQGPVADGANIDTSSTGTKTFTVNAKDNAGNTNSVSHTYTVNNPTTPGGDTTAPTVVSTVPGSGATGVSPSINNVKATFSEAMDASTTDGDPSTITATTFMLFQNGSTAQVAAKVSYDSSSRTAKLNPNNNLSRGVTYRAVLTTGVQDVAGNSLAQQKEWLFKVKR